MSIFALTAAALAFGAAAPEPAPAPAPIAPVVAASSSALATIDATADTRRVCVVDTNGSMMKRTYCQTRAEWIAQGTDPLASR